MANSVKDMVKDSKVVVFMFYRSKELWYRTECGFEFPVPVEDTGSATFNSTDKAIYFMRWINAHMKAVKLALSST